MAKKTSTVDDRMKALKVRMDRLEIQKQIIELRKKQQAMKAK